MSSNTIACVNFDIVNKLKVKNQLTLAERKEQKQKKYKIFSAFIDGFYNIEFPEIQLTEGGIFKITKNNEGLYTKGELDPQRMKINVPFDTTQENSKYYDEFFEKIDEYLQSDEFLTHLFGSRDEYLKKKDTLQYNKLVRNPAEKSSEEDDEKKSSIKYKNIKLRFKLKLPKPNESFDPIVLTKVYVTDQNNPDSIELLNTTNFLEIEKYIGRNAKIIPTIRPISIYLMQTPVNGKTGYGIKFELTTLIITDRGNVLDVEPVFNSIYGSKFKLKKQNVSNESKKEIDKSDDLTKLLTGQKSTIIKSKIVNDDDDDNDDDDNNEDDINTNIKSDSDEEKEKPDKTKKSKTRKNKKVLTEPLDSDEELN